MTKILPILAIFALAALSVACTDDGSGGAALTTAEPTPERPAGEFVVFGAEPVAFAFTPDGRLFFTLRQEGEIRWVRPGPAGTGDADPNERGELFAFVDTFSGSECGLLGIAIDPEFEQNRFVYVYVTQPDATSSESAKPRVIRFTEVDGEGVDPTPIIDDLPLTNPDTCAHVGGNLHFGPDGYLYVSIGNNERPETAGDLGSPLGKILRVNGDGTAAADNPFVDEAGADPRVFAYGLRNPWDFAFHPATGRMYAPDNGPGFCDELNIIEAGQDYGVPRSLPGEAPSSCSGLGGIDPIYTFAIEGRQPHELGSNVAPAGVAFESAGAYAELGEGLLVCAFNTSEMHHLEFEGPELDKVIRDVVVARHCSFNVEVDAEGVIYYSLSTAFDLSAAGSSGIYRLPPDSLGQESR